MHARPNAAIGYGTFAFDVMGYVASVACVLLLSPLWAKLLASVCAGVFLVNLGALAHEAAHKSIVRSRRGNKVMAIVCFTLTLFNYRLWVFEHHTVHHAETNEGWHNSWRPFSKTEFDRLPAWRRVLERMYRSSYGVGIAPYYLAERWWNEHLFPRAWVPERFVASAWRYFWSMIIYASLLVGLLLAAPRYSSTGSVTAILLGFALPFTIWMTTFSLSVYLQHTHPLVAWYRDSTKGTKWPSESLTVHVRLPYLFGLLTHFAMEHPVHHFNTSIPFYRLHAAQRELMEHAPDAIVSFPLSLRNVRAVMKACKLFDFERRCWTDFSGVPTGPALTAEPARLGAHSSDVIYPIVPEVLAGQRCDRAPDLARSHMPE